MTPLRVTGTTTLALTDWESLWSTPGAYEAPESLPTRGWLPAVVPGTVAASARGWDVVPDAASRPDEHDWWYRCRFAADLPGGGVAMLRLDGLATIADVWFNGVHMHRGESMFLAHSLEAGPLLRPGTVANELVLRFAALTPVLTARRPRPRWRTKLVAQQNLRWTRTTLLGHIPSWSAGPVPVGPWRPVSLVVSELAVIAGVDVSTGWDGESGVIDVALDVHPTRGRQIAAARLRVHGATAPLTVNGSTADRSTANGNTVNGNTVNGNTANGSTVSGHLSVPGTTAWMPHTHGEPSTYPITVVIDLDDGVRVDIDLGRTGFRTSRFVGDPSDFALVVNDVAVFFRGGCWTPLDPLALTAATPAYRRALRQLREAGANMVRVCGPTYYESDDFYACCDELGIAVWQDFMFANMDYPFADEAFDRLARAEAGQVLQRLSPHPCVTVLCGNSEVSQQAAMLGLPADHWAGDWFDQTLRHLCATRIPTVAYWPSSPSGGPLPMHPAMGDAHYQGVGAYLRDLADAELSGVRFASESLAFANVPEPSGLTWLAETGELSVQSPRWKHGSPRDRGAGWDFDDVRDEYLARLFGVDALRVRYCDMDRYLALARVTTGEIMHRVFVAWRAGTGGCRGALVWWWRDTLRGAGWGVIDVDEVPKAAYHYLRRAWRPLAVFLVDRGLNGLHARIVNDRAESRDLVLRILLYQRDRSRPTVAERMTTVAGASTTTVSVDDMVGGFRDLNWAYRFGPAPYQVVLAEIVDPRSIDEVLAEDFYFPAGLSATEATDIDLATTVSPAEHGFAMTLCASRTAQAVHIDVIGYDLDDNYFHLAPGRPKQVRLRPAGPATSRYATVSALNSPVLTTVVLDR